MSWSNVSSAKPKGKSAASKRKVRAAMVPIPVSEEVLHRFTLVDHLIYELLCKQPERNTAEDMLEHIVRVGEKGIVIDDVWRALDNAPLANYILRINKFEWKVIKVAGPSKK